MSINQKLLAGFFLVAVAPLMVFFYVHFTVQEEALNNFQEVGERIMPGTVSLAGMSSELFSIAYLLDSYAEERPEESRKKIDNALSSLHTYMTMHALYHEGDVWHQQINASVQRFSSFITEYLLLIQKGAAPEELQATKLQIKQLCEEFSTRVTPHFERDLAASLHKLETTKHEEHIAHKWMLGSGLAILLAAVGLSLFMSRRLSRPLLQLRDAVLEIGRGKLDLTLDATSRGETGELARAFNEMTSNLSTTRKDLVRARDYMDNIIGSMIDTLIVTSTDGTIEKVNAAACSLLGCREDEVVGQPIKTFISGEVFLGEDLVGLAAKGLIKNLTSSYRTKGGGKIPISLSASVMLDGERNIQAIIWVARDIRELTELINDLNKSNLLLRKEIYERVQAEKALKESEQNYWEIFNATDEAIFIHDAETAAFLDVNRAVLEMYGYSYEEVLQLHIEDLSANEPPYTMAEAGQWVKRAVEGVPQVFDWLARRKNGELFWVEVSLRSSEIGGEQRVLAVVRDISARKHAEEALRKTEARQALILRSLPMAFYAFKVEAPLGVYGDIWVSDQVDRLCGFTPEQFAADIDFWASRVHADDRQRTLEIFESILEKQNITLEYRWQHADGKYRWFEDNAVLIVDESGRPLEIIGTWLDISDRKKIERELRQAQKMEAVGTLAGGIAHDFNNILSSIIGYTELARMEAGDDSELSPYLEEVNKAGMRARDLVQQILTFGRRTEQEKQPLQIAIVIKEALKMLRSTIPTTIEIRRDIESKGTALADPTQVHQIIMNLCTNAYHAMRETGGTLAVSLKEVEIKEFDYPSANIEPGKYIRLEVSDTGHGMDAKTREKIFEPYYTTKEAGEGTGLGLAVVHGIVEGHNGHITVYSEPGQGTTFHVYLPLIEGEPEHIQRRRETNGRRRGTERIAIVDDEENIVKFAKDALTKYGYHITTYTNGIQALQEFIKHPHDFDLFITDMTMPYMTGAELGQKLLGIRADLPIILCTGYSELISREKAYAMGISEYIQKPLVLDNFLETIRNVLDKT